MEADLARYYQSTIYEFYEGRLSLWQLAVRVRYLPIESACNQVMGADGLTVAEYLLFDLFNLQTEKPHPGDPRARRAEAAQKQALAAAKARSDARRQKLNIRGSVFRKNR
ncbi:hypothetical protein EMG21_28450 [Klebsiella pneumoniae]|nr:hypothetical protein EMG21_28450 [Klebsiella pneumoniae]